MLLFAYATLQNENLLNSILGYIPHHETYNLSGYRKIYTYIPKEKENYPNLNPSNQKETVDGILLHITSSDLKKLNEYEKKYKLIKLVLKDGREAYYFSLT